VNPVLLQSARVDRKDISSANAYLNNEKLFYSFGQAWGNINISGEVLLGPVCLGDAGPLEALSLSVGNGLRIVEMYFDTFRASKHKRPITLSSLRYAKPVQFYLTNYTRGTVNLEYNTVGFNLQGFVIDKDKGFLEDVLDQLTGAASAGIGEVTQGVIGGIL
jgi:hypothetical protein